MRVSKADQDEAMAQLKKILCKGDRIYCVLAHRSASGMRREIKLYKITNQGPRWLSGYASKVLEWPLGKNSGVVVDGAGMDMGFHTVYELSRALFEDPQALKHEWL